MLGAGADTAVTVIVEQEWGGGAGGQVQLLVGGAAGGASVNIRTGRARQNVEIMVTGTRQTKNTPVKRTGRNVVKRTGRKATIFFILFKHLVRRIKTFRLFPMSA